MVDHKKESEIIGRNLKAIRLQKNLAQIDVAVAADLNRTYVSRIENGKARITFVTLYRLVKGLEVTSDKLIGPYYSI